MRRASSVDWYGGVGNRPPNRPGIVRSGARACFGPATHPKPTRLHAEHIVGFDDRGAHSLARLIGVPAIRLGLVHVQKRAAIDDIARPTKRLKFETFGTPQSCCTRSISGVSAAPFGSSARRPVRRSSYPRADPRRRSDHSRGRRIDKRGLTQRDATLGYRTLSAISYGPNGVRLLLRLQRRHEALTHVARRAHGATEGADLKSACRPVGDGQTGARALRVRHCNV
ncbi:hypothetical protein BurMR1_1916 [Burkholderia sp. MR1]|nr:hypothetical protein BurMR1_1916 [Burkholderia sp. MR1]